MTTQEKLEKLGFTTASNKIKEVAELKRKMVIAYEHFRYVKPDKFQMFEAKLRAETMQETHNERRYKTLAFIPIEKYSEIPPVDVLEKLEKAQEMNCFDYFEVAKIEARVEVKDPIIFGCIKGCPDKFYVAQWDDDVKIQDILKENEG